MKHASRIIALAVLLAFPVGCATEGSVDVGVGFYGSYWEDPWYWSGCCVDPPGSIGPPPHPEHPIALPPDAPRPSHPIANAPEAKPTQPAATQRSAPSPRPAMRSGGGGGGRGGRR